MKFVSFVFFLLLNVSCDAARFMAITIDDFPYLSENTQEIESVHRRITDTLLHHNAPATFFVIANRLNTPQQKKEVWHLRDLGFDVGNHSYSHMSLRKVGVSEYIQDVNQADLILKPMLSSPKYFRYPYLAQGRWWWNRRKVYDYLKKHHYVIAPMTIDSRDFEFNLQMIQKGTSDALKKEYLAFVWQQTLKAEARGKASHQILMIHTNLLTSYYLDALLNMYEKNGYHFITLKDALRE